MVGWVKVMFSFPARSQAGARWWAFLSHSLVKRGKYLSISDSRRQHNFPFSSPGRRNSAL